MIAPSLLHHTFTLERRYPVSPTKAFAAWREPTAKRRWFTSDRGEFELDVFLDGQEQPSWREAGTADQLDTLAVELQAARR